MDGIVETVNAFMARREIIPTVINANTIAIQQVEIESYVSGDTRKPLVESFIIL